jgi:holo-[acyl-carrier-protein] synthase
MGRITVPVGVDVVAVQRIRDDVERWGKTFLDRVLTPAEAQWCAAADDPETRVAACVAGKECVIKVLGGRPRGFAWRDVELFPNAGASWGPKSQMLVIGRWYCDWRGAHVQVAAVSRGPHVIALAQAV